VNIPLAFRHRGVTGVVARAGSILGRFGISPGQMQRRLEYYADLTANFGVQPSWAITACILSRNTRMIRTFAERGVEFAIHGLIHNDHSLNTFEEQRESIAKAAELFRRAGVSYSGFRAPFLRSNHATDRAVRSLGLRYNSTQPVIFPAPSAGKARECGDRYRRALTHLYVALDASRLAVRPFYDDGIVNIPVALPDDEIMIERLRISDQEQAQIWLDILETTHARGDLFTLQLHPERIYECAYATRELLAAARRREPPVWIATLGEIAEWWHARRSATLDVQDCGGGAFRIRLAGGVPGATVLVRGLNAGPASPWMSRDSVARTHDFLFRSTVKPVVGISSRSPRALLDFLQEEGLQAEVSDHPEQFGAYIDVDGNTFDQARVLNEIEQSPGPLVRIWRWPNGTRSALAVTGDIDCITVQDFAFRIWETRG
jgi:peptidoglycan/xylan/chitin deacetylase (PgdA/CDA1 family)